MIKTIKLEQYTEDIAQIIKTHGFRQCEKCKKITAGIYRYSNDEYFYIKEIKDCSEHVVFDLIFANTTEAKGLMIYDRLN